MKKCKRSPFRASVWFVRSGPCGVLCLVQAGCCLLIQQEKKGEEVLKKAINSPCWHKWPILSLQWHNNSHLQTIIHSWKRNYEYYVPFPKSYILHTGPLKQAGVYLLETCLTCVRLIWGQTWAWFHTFRKAWPWCFPAQIVYSPLPTLIYTDTAGWGTLGHNTNNIKVTL